jgi:hypothetical protein
MQLTASWRFRIGVALIAVVRHFSWTTVGSSHNALSLKQKTFASRVFGITQLPGLNNV